MPVVFGQADVLVDRLQHDLLLGRDSVRMTQLESIVQAVNRVDQDRVVDEVRRETGGFARARGLVVQVLPGEGVLRHVEAEQHPFAEVLAADVRIQVFPLRLGRVFRRPVGVKGRVAQGAGHPDAVRRLHAARIIEVLVDGPFLGVEVLVLEELQADNSTGEAEDVRVPGERAVLHPVNPEAVLVWLLGGHAIGIVDEPDLFPPLGTRHGVQHPQKINPGGEHVFFLAGELGHLAPEPWVIDAAPPVPGVHAVADLLRVDAIALGRPVGVGLAVPVIRLLAVLHRPAEGVLDLVAVRGERGGAIPADAPHGCQGQRGQGATRDRVSVSRFSWLLLSLMLGAIQDGLLKGAKSSRRPLRGLRSACHFVFNRRSIGHCLFFNRLLIQSDLLSRLCITKRGRWTSNLLRFARA